MPPSRRNNTVRPALLRARPLPLRAGDKDSRGCALVVAGSPSLPGPVILAGVAALRAGAGKLQIATAAETTVAIGCAVPEALVVTFEHAERLAQHAHAIVFGPGMSDDSQCAQLLARIAAIGDAPMVLDAAALRVLGNAGVAAGSGSVLTPHAGEMASLLACERTEVERDPEGALAACVQRYGATVVLKGAHTLIAAPGSEIYRNEKGTMGLATSGSGDVLAGIIGGLLARGAEPLQAALWGVYLHARAGARLVKRSGIGFLAREIAAEVPAIMRAV